MDFFTFIVFFRIFAIFLNFLFDFFGFQPTLGQRRQGERGDGRRAGALAHQRHAGGVAVELFGVPLEPLEGELQVVEAEVAFDPAVRVGHRKKNEN